MRLHVAVTSGTEIETSASLLENEYSANKRSTSDEKPTSALADNTASVAQNTTSDGNESLLYEYSERPDIEKLIREPVEAAWGETAVVVCGGQEIVARTRNCVSRLSDERAVHKGTGAQGIYLHVEEYSF